MGINLNFADVEEYSMIPEGPNRVTIKEAKHNPGGGRTSTGKVAQPCFEIVVMPNVPPSHPLADQKIRSWVYYTGKSAYYAKLFFEALYQQPFDEEVDIEPSDMLGMGIVANVFHEETEYQPKKDGRPIGNKKKGIFAKVDSWAPDVE